MSMAATAVAPEMGSGSSTNTVCAWYVHAKRKQRGRTRGKARAAHSTEAHSNTDRDAREDEPAHAPPCVRDVEESAQRGVKRSNCCIFLKRRRTVCAASLHSCEASSRNQ
eukprot:6197003-Pleurochrysis_carterae.AAC.1